ncbi:hypothetical protein PSN45_004280 [Yamadazyma tenuis]|uniref:uncharacterized protein n=1 Tax=Candida tenuis TaxID=2315449 RepID=UPI0027A35940|nr:hypothetical protein PSN45_004280 [Yamadazyma tenuis]
MASAGFTSCCFQLALHEGTAQGVFKTIGGLDTYVIGQSKRVLVIMTDVFGYKLNNTLLIADNLAHHGDYTVLVPDILQGDPIVERPSAKGIEEWRAKHAPSVTGPIVEGFLKELRQQQNPTFLGGIGYCFGAKYVIPYLTKDGLLDAGAVAHPSFLTLEEIEGIEKPILISTSVIDQSFTVELRRATEDILTKKEGLKWQLGIYSGCSHGYAVRGDVSIPSVKYAKEATLLDQLNFFGSSQ